MFPTWLRIKRKQTNKHTQISCKTLLFTSNLFTRMHRETHCHVMLDQMSDIVTPGSGLPEKYDGGGGFRKFKDIIYGLKLCMALGCHFRAYVFF